MPRAASLESVAMSTGFCQFPWVRALAAMLLVASLLSSAAIARERVHLHEAGTIPDGHSRQEMPSPENDPGVCERCAHVAAEIAQHTLEVVVCWSSGIPPAMEPAGSCPATVEAPPLRPPRLAA